ncbi:major histocompatibility complex class I-related gene protein-like isoform X3 [Embiotoca jacksoni]|uniref:major histocompatibility complex class I-related gene protein-like isoform X3 n=1 Tax=Embiotoca jacksoni TaxID=100190 RepID=UPI0037043D39
MKVLVVLVLLGIHNAAAVTHSLKYFSTSSSQVPNFPEFVAVGLVDEVQMFHYDSNTKTAVPKQDWMKKAEDDDPKYWEWNTANCMDAQQINKASIETIKQRFNQTGGVHIFQWMYGCEWDDETKEVNGFHQYSYDGEDFISFDLKTETWIAPQQQAVITKHKLDNNKALITQYKNYHTHICPEWLKKYVNYGRSSLMTTELPSVSLLQKTSSSPVTCHATGFHPDRAMMFWRKDGEEFHEGVDEGEILHNNDGTFQKSVDLDLTSVPPEDWKRYECVFQLSGVNEDQITKLDKAVIRTNEGNHIIIITVIAAVVLVVVLAAIGSLVYKKKTAAKPYLPRDRKTSPDTSPTESLRSTGSYLCFYLSVCLSVHKCFVAKSYPSSFI